MENIRNELPPQINQFFSKLSNYINEKLYFYGSVQRKDYISNNSDIDVCIFTDNVHTVNNKLLHFLHLHKKSIKKIMWTAHPSHRIVYGYKLKYTHANPEFKLEVAVYNDKYKHDILIQHNLKNDLPFYTVFVLTILKYIYYYLNLISKKNYSYYKNKIMNYSLGHPDNNLVIISPNFQMD